MRRVGLGLAMLLAGCANNANVKPMMATTVMSDALDSGSNGWRGVATPEDRQRIGHWRTAFTEALDKARAAGNGPDIDQEGALLDPDAALADPAIPPGDYNCRVIKLGAKGPAMLNFVRYPAFTCRVAQEGEMMSLMKMTGSQRPVGLLFDADSRRQVFLGTLLLGDEAMAMDYGADSSRDLAGAVERIGEKRWRLVLPYPHFESILDVIELVPQA